MSNESREAFYPGQLLNDKYVLINIIGSGAYADVWLALDYIPNKCYAIKIHEEGYYDIAEKELNILKSLSKSKSITHIIGHFIHDDLTFDQKEDSDLEIDFDQYLCLVFDLMGGTVYDLIKTGPYAHGLPINFVKSVVRNMLKGMIELDNVGKCHTDIKPENTLIVGYGKYENIVRYITEFNFAKKHSDNIKTAISRSKNKKINRKQIAFNSIKTVFNSLLSGATHIIEELNKKKEEIDHECNKYQIRNRSCLYDSNHLSLDNISSKLGDVGSAEDKDNIKNSIQTRYYRSPEVILKSNINTTCDVWSIGCSLYELLTGELLFEPEKQTGFSRDRHHLNDMQKVFGIIPHYIIDKSQIKRAFYREDGGMKNKLACGYTPLTKILKKKMALNNPEYYDTNDFYCLCDLLYKIFDYDINNRITAEKCLEHEWLYE